MPDHPITSRAISSQKGRKPRTAWGEAIRGLGADFEDWALRNSLNFQWRSLFTPPPTRRLRCPCRGEGHGAATQPQTLMNRIHREHADLP
jgi:hypothetical protein